MATPPHDTAIEAQVIGACLIDPDLAPRIAAILQPHDLYSPAHQHILAAIYAEHDDGHHVAAATVSARVTSQVTDARTVIADCITACSSTTAAPTLAVKLADYAALRRVQGLAIDTLNTIDTTADPSTVIDHLSHGLATIDLASDSRTIDGLWTAEAMMDANFVEPESVIPGFMSREDRLMWVGPEGKGKSVLGRQMAAQVAVGVHPLWPDHRIPPQTTLLVDVENSERVIRTGLRMMKCQPSNMHVLARPGGMNLRTRRDHALLHRACERIQPRLLVIGPLYKMVQAERGESDEQFALAVARILDELRVRFGCALIIEHHAPHGSDMFRNMRPVGSSVWLRWPEFGWKLLPYDPAAGIPTENGDALQLGTFRGDRVPISKPAYFYRGEHGWPWMPYWPDGSPYRRAEARF